MTGCWPPSTCPTSSPSPCTSSPTAGGVDGVQPVVSVAEMREADAHAPVPTDVLIGRAGRAVAGAAARMLGGVYGRRILVVAGKGNNGADGRAAATFLAQRGARVQVVAA